MKNYQNKKLLTLTIGLIMLLLTIALATATGEKIFSYQAQNTLINSTIKFAPDVSNWTNLNDNCSNIVFKSENGVTTYNHYTLYCDKTNPDKNAIFYIQIPSQTTGENKFQITFDGLSDTSTTDVFLIFDDFNRADNDTIGNALTGQTWVEEQDVGAVIEILNNQLHYQAGYYVGGITYIDISSLMPSPYSQDVILEQEWRMPTFIGDGYLMWLTESTGYYQHIYRNINTIYCRDNGALTPFYTLTENNTYTFTMNKIGISTHNIYVDDNFKISCENSYGATNSQVASVWMWGYVGSHNYVDNFKLYYGEYGIQFQDITPISECTIDTDCELCQKCDMGNCINQPNTEDTKNECDEEYSCLNAHTYNQETGYCDGNGACAGTSRIVDGGKVCINSTNYNSPPTADVNCYVWNDCIKNRILANEYYVGYNHYVPELYCDSTEWVSKGTNWNVPLGYEIITTAETTTCEVEPTNQKTVALTLCGEGQTTGACNPNSQIYKYPATFTCETINAFTTWWNAQTICSTGKDLLIMTQGITITTNCNQQIKDVITAKGCTLKGRINAKTNNDTTIIITSIEAPAGINHEVIYQTEQPVLYTDLGIIYTNKNIIINNISTTVNMSYAKDFLTFETNEITINATAVPSIEAPATLIWSGITREPNVIYKDGVACSLTECTGRVYNPATDTYEFVTQEFSTFSLGFTYEETDVSPVIFDIFGKGIVGFGYIAGLFGLVLGVVAIIVTVKVARKK